MDCRAINYYDCTTNSYISKQLPSALQCNLKYRLCVKSVHCDSKMRIWTSLFPYVMRICDHAKQNALKYSSVETIASWHDLTLSGSLLTFPQQLLCFLFKKKLYKERRADTGMQNTMGRKLYSSVIHAVADVAIKPSEEYLMIQFDAAKHTRHFQKQRCGFRYFVMCFCLLQVIMEFPSQTSQASRRQ